MLENLKQPGQESKPKTEIEDGVVYFLDENGRRKADVVEEEKAAEEQQIREDGMRSTDKAVSNEAINDEVYELSISKINEEEKELEAMEGRGWLTDGQRQKLNVLLVSLGVAVAGAAVKQGYDQVTESFSEQDNVEVVADSIADKKFNDEVDKYLSKLNDFRIQSTMNRANAYLEGKDSSVVDYFVNGIQFRSEDDQRTNRPALPEELQNELREKLPGWIAQESTFDAEAFSKSGAVGYVQAMPFVYEEYYGTKEVATDIDSQIEFMGLHTSNNYHYITYYAGDDVLETLKSKYDSEEDYIKDLMAPLVINSYNSGGPIIGKILNQFVGDIPADELKGGKDLFVQFAEYAHENFADKGYVTERREYVPKIYAFQQAINESKYNNTHLAQK